MKTYSYEYTDNSGNPLKTCPFCFGDLTKIQGIAIVLSVGREHFRWKMPGRLDERGNLLELKGTGVAEGQHNETRCGYCELRLIDSDSVIERQAVTLQLLPVRRK